MICPYIPPPPTIQQQLGALQHHFPTGQGTVCDHDLGLHWQGELQPTVFSRTYLVGIQYKREQFPHTFVYSPDLNQLKGGKRIPHTFSQQSDETEICLFWPGKNKGEIPEWNRDMLLATSIVPWATLWLYYFEHWLASGEWHGGGYHDNELRFDQLVERGGRHERYHP